MSRKKQGKSDVADRAAKMIAGINKHLGSTSSILLAGGAFAPADVTSRLQALVDLRQDVETARAATQAKLAAEAVQAPALRTFLGAAVTFATAAFGNAPDVLADFGLDPAKPRARQTAEAKTAAAVKRKATRTARHTMGSQQKQTVKGAVSGIVVTPVVASPAAPAAPGSSGTSTAAPVATPAAAPRTA